jgi:hypothetical protein
VVDNLIISSDRGLRRKYGPRAAEVRAAIDRLVASHATRGVATVVDLVDTDATPLADGPAWKAAIDGHWSERQPATLTLLGAWDVVPHLLLDNPAASPDDDDHLVPSDLPYACDGPASTDVGDFLDPVRVVGRLPDAPETDDPTALVQIIDVAAGSVPQAGVASAFAPTARVWEASTAANALALFGGVGAVRTVPPSGRPWAAGWHGRSVHLVNCHGAPFDASFYGEWDDAFPTALTSGDLATSPGHPVAVAAECCYGADLFDPAGFGSDPPIALAYLAAGAVAYLGSTCIAYGPPHSVDWADLMCQLFLSNLLDGQPSGRALLDARRAYLARPGALDPLDLKTVAQFTLLGDPTVQPFAAPGEIATWGSGEDGPASDEGGAPTETLAAEAASAHRRASRRRATARRRQAARLARVGPTPRWLTRIRGDLPARLPVVEALEEASPDRSPAALPLPVRPLESVERLAVAADGRLHHRPIPIHRDTEAVDRDDRVSSGASARFHFLTASVAPAARVSRVQGVIALEVGGEIVEQREFVSR